MDYGHTIEGTKRPIVSGDNPADNLNTDNWQAISELPGRPFADHEKAPSGQESLAIARVAITSGSDAPLGEVTTVAGSTAPAPVAPTSFEPSLIHTSGDHLDAPAIAAVDHAISELGQTGDLSDFYAEVQAMTEANLKNSFSHQIGEQ